MNETLTALDVRLFMQRAGADLLWMQSGESVHALGGVRVHVMGRMVLVYALKNKRFSPVLVSKLPVNKDEFTITLRWVRVCSGIRMTLTPYWVARGSAM